MKINVLFLIVFWVLGHSYSLAQETVTVEILNSEDAEMTYEENNPVKKLIGNVRLRHKGTLMYCDKATIYHTNNIFAENNIKIVRPNGTIITGNTLNYLSEQKLAKIDGNVVLTNKKTKLYTPDITYEMNEEVGYFTNGGRVENDSTTITSRHGTYFTKTSQVFFKFDVKVVNPQYTLTSDTLEYNTKLKRNYFYSGTKIENDSGYIWCNKGWYNENDHTASFGQGTIIYNQPKWMITDSIYYEKNTGFGRIYKYFEYHDTSAHIHVFGDTAEYWNKTGQVIAYRRPLMIYETDNKNPLFIRADILEQLEIDQKKSFFGYCNVRLYNRDFQAETDSLSYLTNIDKMFLRENPIAWLVDSATKKTTQLIGNEIVMALKNKKVETIDANTLALMVQQEYKEDYFNQIQADTINIFFSNQKIDKLFAQKNAQSAYLADDPPKGYLGLNKSESEKLVAYFDTGKLSRIVFLATPKAIFYPTKDITKINSRLPRFSWQIHRRPKSKDDL